MSSVQDLKILSAIGCPDMQQFDVLSLCLSIMIRINITFVCLSVRSQFLKSLLHKILASGVVQPSLNMMKLDVFHF